MGLSHRDELRDRVQSLVDDVGPLHTVAGLGLVEPEARRLDPALARLRDQPGWSLVDLRRSSGEDAAEALIAAMGAEVLIIVAQRRAPRALYELIRAGVDRSLEVSFAGHAPRSRRGDQTMIVVLSDAASLEGLDRDFVRIPYWDFVS